MQLIDANAGYQVLDELFSQIEGNDYKATPQMLDEASEKYNSLAARCDLEEITSAVENLARLCEIALG